MKVSLHKLFGLVLFLFLIGIKVSACHVYTHEENDQDSVENCLVCEDAIENQLNPFTPATDAVALETPIRITTTVKIVAKSSVVYQATTVALPFSRPPPRA